LHLATKFKSLLLVAVLQVLVRAMIQPVVLVVEQVV
jgi:hypothetical protein